MAVIENQPKEEVIVSIIIPVKNEEKYISKCIKSVLRQNFDKKNMELILIDGNSKDETVKIIRNFMNDYGFIKVYKNPQETVQYALNIGIKNAAGKYIVRMDAHSEYADDYVSKCVEYIEKTGAENVGGPMIAQGKTQTQNVIAAAYHNPFAMGGGKFHNENYEGYADTVYLGAFKKETLLHLNMYDERLPRSEDDDLNFRILENGGKIFVTPKIKSVYYPRSTYSDVFKQFFEYGLWKVAVIKKHKKPARLSHLVPISFVIFIILFSILSFFSAIARNIFLFIMLIYFGLNLYFSLKNKRLNVLLDKFRLVWVHFVLHISYGLGFLCGIFKFWRIDF
ncbi:MAG: glycosyltransferase [Acutalibacteraceae bacterium]|jgi:succinoglycan biosynthesis protein ExoA